MIIQDGLTDFTNPVGTGPFKFQEFTVGERSLCVRNENYWEEGKPYVDEWEDISISDNAARLNALLAGEIDMMSQIEPTAGEGQPRRGSDPGHSGAQPDGDPGLLHGRRRPALRRPARPPGLPAHRLTGRGSSTGRCSVLPPWRTTYPARAFGTSRPTCRAREQDLEQAKALLAQAGKENLEVTLHTSEIVPGFVEAATLFAEMAKGAGVTVNVKKEDPNAYFDTSKLYTKLDFGQSFWTYASLGIWYEQALLSDGIWNETHWRDPSFDERIRAAQGAATEEEAVELWHQVQEIQYNEGGYIVWANLEILDAAANYVQGIVPSAWFNLGGWNYRDVWLDV